MTRFLLAALLLLATASRPGHAAPVISDLHTDRARYAPGAPVTLAVTLTNGGTPAQGTVAVSCLHLDAPVPGPAARPFRLAAGGAATLQFSWRPPTDDYRGYAILVSLRDAAGHVEAVRSTAVDVSSGWARFLRYGYVTDFGAQTAATARQRVRQLADYHLDALQFYDWQYKHQTPLAGTVERPAASWTNLTGGTNFRRTVLDDIDAAHGLGMAALNYNLLYGAWAGYSDDGVDYRWGLWKKNDGTDQDRLPMPQGWATPAIYLFNPADPGWQRYLIGQEAKVFAAYPFDGWHIDEIGSPSGADYDYGGKTVDVWPTFKPFLDAAQAALHRPLIFNNVGGYGLFDTAAHTADAAVYVECWPYAGQTSYNDLKTLIGQCSEWSGGKAVALAAYMDYDYGNTFRGRAPGTFNTPGVLLTDATIFASGGTHIEMGDGAAMLDNEYFPNRNLAPSAALRDALRGYYDFLVAYENLLRGGLRDGGAVSLSVPSSADGAPDTVWAFTRSGNGSDVLHLINLVGEHATDWRDDKADHPVPTVQHNVVVTYRPGAGVVRKVTWASPDAPDIAPRALPFTTGADTGGAFVRFTVPKLAYWDMIRLTVGVKPTMPRTRAG